MKFPYSENKSQRIFEYIRSKYSLDWILMKPNVKTENDNVLEKVDREAARKGVAMFYEVDETMDRFKISCELIEDEVKYAMAHNTRVVFIIPPSAFGEWPGHDLSLEFARRMQEKYGCEVYNYANAILDRQYYYDHHHLNSKGVTYFAEHCLKPILEDNSEN